MFSNKRSWAGSELGEKQHSKLKTPKKSCKNAQNLDKLTP